ncbi:hypothetical protein [Rhabdothermincola salaria]|uniref:hypothetical protein n=1 Tax=Rhabdothermincola salaria TaxID=2903142 RepID=UPI001E35FED6|nr:hypothetical protein [Rhabdothermincola salaria]MCD9624202.1 hypothetical protein [Rhabdothermincola salaria]
MPNFVVECSFYLNIFLAGLGTDDVDQYGVDEFFPYAAETDWVMNGFDVLGETTDPVGTDLSGPSGPEPRASTLVDRMRDPSPEEFDAFGEWGGVVVGCWGTCKAVVSAPSEAAITDQVVQSELPKEFFAGDLPHLTVGLDPNV